MIWICFHETLEKHEFVVVKKGRFGVRPVLLLNCGGEGHTGVYTNESTHQTEHLKWEHFIVCKLYLNDFDLKVRIDKFIELDGK